VDDDLTPDPFASDAPGADAAAPDDAPPADAGSGEELPEWARLSGTAPVEDEIDVDVLRVDEESVEIEEIIEIVEVSDATLADAELLDVSDLDGDDEMEPSVPAEPSPYDKPGDWFVVHTYAGYENKVKQNLGSRVRSMNVEERIFEVVIPMEDVIEFKGGRKVVVQKKIFPGYLYVRMDLDDDSWYVVRNTPGVTGFVGNGARPTPLSRKEVEGVLGTGVKEEAGVEKKARPRLDFEVAEQVRVTQGPFADFNGVISDIDVARSKLTVLVNIFGRETPVELELGQVAKL
jgi:transcriptional antiterminator NusG